MSEIQRASGKSSRSPIPLQLDGFFQPIRRLISIVAMMAVLLLVGCRDLDDESGGPERVEHESAALPSLVVQMSQEAQEEVGLKVTPLSRQMVSESLGTTGWLQAVPGSEWTIRAPVVGFFTPVSESQILTVGQTVETGQTLGQLQAFASPLDAVQLLLAKEEADAIIGQSTASLKIAEEQLSGLTESNATGAISGIRLQQLRETADQARVAIREAREKLPYLPDESYDGTFNLKPLPLGSPRQGTVTQVHVVPRQFVAAGDLLYTVVDWSSLWLKVPLFEADYHRVLPAKSAEITFPGQKSVMSVEPVVVPSAIPPGGRTISRYYRVDNRESKLRPGEPLAIALPTGEEAEEIVVPSAAVIWDGFGNAWVYVRIEETAFRRTRVELGQPVGDSIVVRRGLDVGAEVVTTGAQVLYGEEFRGQIQVEDDD